MARLFFHLVIGLRGSEFVKKSRSLVVLAVALIKINRGTCTCTAHHWLRRVTLWRFRVITIVRRSILVLTTAFSQRRQTVADDKTHTQRSSAPGHRTFLKLLAPI